MVMASVSASPVSVLALTVLGLGCRRLVLVVFSLASSAPQQRRFYRKNGGGLLRRPKSKTGGVGGGLRRLTRLIDSDLKETDLFDRNSGNGEVVGNSWGFRD
ncbi:hypothetical protein PF005_g15414 [Phytophthora fragariae]|uniref:Uncharacterized protein n=1 Tax=Phytophthora fragariae TaxID=53985 RepID=A0A6A3XL68_9STRA|nr:hypothetical protein PF003_g29742 [Phytophthora fragariae]KAE8934058.1 hypothetical protein PF009_g15957 [Phytophthora fragariae]KAE9000138.1 hypothetical protein PF011_g14321 [Phytophthora fragariae]KAE9081465.1 hypothetical protein PF007_g22650 [Phytophthora fragariae]KAE9134375.1 hypothetical protein PF006_g14850 [Phytophthora fragariae]